MVILSNCLTQTPDEGCLKVANSLIRRIKKLRPETTVITYDRHSPLGDVHLSLNKLLLSGKLMRLLRQKKEPVLYAPSLTRILPTAVRTFILSLFARWGLQVFLVMQAPLDRCSKLLFKLSHAQLITLSKQACQQYEQVVGKRVRYIKAGVDTERFCPAAEDKAKLREKYGFSDDRPIILHVGHLKAGRNIGCLLSVGDWCHVVLVVSTLTTRSQDAQLRQQMERKGNITLIDTYCPNIEELYRLADVYLFPVVESGQCIDAPLSVLEAAACDLPVVTTPFGELKQLLSQDGFYEIDDFAPERLNDLLQKAYEEKKSTRSSVLEYDWNMAVHQLLSEI